MKIIIIGAGIGGLTTYHSLQKHLSHSDDPPSPPPTITIYESHPSPSSITSNTGGGLGLAPNGLRAIASVAPRAAAYIQARGYPGAIMTFRNATGRLLGRYWNGRAERYGFGTLMLRRAVVHEALLRDVPAGAVRWGRRVVAVREGEGGEGVVVEFADGGVETGDLVIGADGVRSVVRGAIFGDKYPAEYDGLTGVGGFIPLSALPPRLRESLRTEGVSMTFGPHGFFGYSRCTAPAPETETQTQTTNNGEIQWWSIYESPLPPTRFTAPAPIRAQLLARHAAWKSPHDTPASPVFQTLIHLGCGSGSLLILPRYVAPRLPHWSSPSGSGRVVLLGDAAHAMPPDSGQGVACAAEDAVALGLLLKHYHLDRGLGVPEALCRTAAAYEGVRMERVWRILDFAKRSGDSKKRLSWAGECVRDCVLWVLCKLPESVNDSWLAYDVDAAVADYLKNAA